MLINWKNKLLAVDKDENCFKIFDTLGNLIETIENSNFNHPNSLILFKENIIVANTWGNNLLFFDKDLNYIKTINHNFAEPTDISSNNSLIYVCNRDNHSIDIFNENLEKIKKYPDLNSFDLYNNFPLYMPSSILINENITYICQINNITAIDDNGYYLFHNKNEKVFEYIKSDGHYIYVLNTLENMIDVYGLSGIYIDSLNLQPEEVFQCFEIVENKIIAFTVFFEKSFIYEIPKLKDENKLLNQSANNPLQLMKLAEIHKSNNDFDKMLETYEKILKYHPGYPPVMKKLNLLIKSMEQ